MSDTRFNIVFYGIVQPGKDRALVMQNMAKLFKTEPAKVKPYFSGNRKVIKTNVDQQTAEKYRSTLEQIGLVIKLEDAVQAAARQPESMAKTGEAETARVDTSGITMAEVGADVLENPPEVEPQPIGDISDLSVAEVGADVIENPKPEKKAPEPDISDLSMAEVGADVIENPKPAKKAPEPDISGLTLDK